VSSGAKAIVCDQAQRSKLEPSEFIATRPEWRIIVVGEDDGNAVSFNELLGAHEAGMAAARLGGDAPIIHIYTSGTTGDPKGVVVPMRALAAFRVYGEYGQGLRPDDIFWCGADPGWAYGLYFGVLTTFTTGTPSILLGAGFTPESTLEVLERERVTNFAAAPTVYRSLRSSGLRPAGLLALRCLSSAGEPLTPEVNAWAEEVFGLVVHDHYGQTEAGMLINNHHHPDVAKPIVEGSMGHAMPGWTAVILDVARRSG
jgi:acetyl-CoA synthetase